MLSVQSLIIRSYICVNRCSHNYSRLSLLLHAVVELRGSKSIIPIVGGAVGGALVIIIFLVLVIVLLLIFVKCKTRSELNDNTLGKSQSRMNYLTAFSFLIILLANHHQYY